MKNYRYCTGCNRTGLEIKVHPLLDNVPICELCLDSYHDGEFIVVDGNELYCRWCGDGGEMFMCDNCPKSFCKACILRNFGTHEFHRISKLEDKWCCYICSPQPIQDLCLKNNWVKVIGSCGQRGRPVKRFKASSNDKLIWTDISNGREKIPIPVFNEIDTAGPPLNFTYITQYVLATTVRGLNLTSNPDLMSCCSCVGDCRDASKCECALAMGGFAYNKDRTLVDEKCVVYECNQYCSCNLQRCTNRVVGNGPDLPLEVFRCTDARKGWGVRCTRDIPGGTYVASYAGEILSEAIAEHRGLCKGDEYLFSLDSIGRSQACELLCSLGMKQGIMTRPPQLDVDTSAAGDNVLRELLGASLFHSLNILGVIDRVKIKETTNCLAPSVAESAVVTESVIAENATAAKRAASHSSMNWSDRSKRKRVKEWRQARGIITDRVCLETEEYFGSCTLDARWFGSVGRFLNHSCQPNLAIVTVFVDSQDIRIPRVAFFATETIKAGAELCYDYGYFPGNVDGRRKDCLCGATNCRKLWY